MSTRPIHGIGRLAALVVLMLVMVSGAWAQTSGVIETRLDNGLTVLMKEVHAAPVFTAQVWFKVGSRNEHTGITGISHMLEHMLFNSSKNYKKGEITRLIRERGGIENAATWTDFTYYWQLMSTDNLDFSLKTLAERVGNALLPDEEFQKERTVVLSELEGRENDTGWLLYRDLMASAFMASPYHWPVIGWKSDVENISIEQLRDYYNAYYHPNNATLVLVGDFDSKKALEMVRKHFGGKPSRELPRPVYTTEPPQRGERTVTLRREGTAERVILGYRVPGIDDPDTYALMILDQVLSGGRSSRLYQALVEKQLATSAWSSAGIRKDPALFMLGATARQGVSAGTLEEALQEQVEIARTTLPTDEEMQAAKNQLQAYLIFQNDSVSDQGEQLGYYSTLADWRYLETLIPRIMAVTAEEVQTVAVKYLVRDSLTTGKFVPTAPGGGGNGAPAEGAVHRGMLPDESQGLSLYRGSGPEPAAKAAQESPARTAQSMVKPHRVVLDNGIVVIVQENRSNPTIAIAGNLKAGSYFDPRGKNGVASLAAEVIGRGTGRRSALELAKEADFVGASLSTSASVESADFGAKSLSKDFPLMLDLLSDQLRNASFPQDQFERAKGETASQLEQSTESPRARAFRAFYGSVFPAGHPYHELTVEQAQVELQSITREDLVQFYSTYYRPDTMTIVIVGDVDANAAVEQVRKYFGDWKATRPAPKVDIPTVPTQKEPVKIEIPMADKSENAVILGYALGVKRSDPDFYAVRVMNQILGGAGALASLLGEEIREKQGLVYNVYSTFDASLGAGPWYASLGTGPKNVDQAVKSLRTEITRFRESGATRKQFDQAREFIVGVFPIALETNAGVARALLNAEFYDLGMDYLRDYASIYRSVTLEQVNAAARKYLHPESATLVVAGPPSEPI